MNYKQLMIIMKLRTRAVHQPHQVDTTAKSFQETAVLPSVSVVTVTSWTWNVFVSCYKGKASSRFDLQTWMCV